MPTCGGVVDLLVSDSVSHLAERRPPACETSPSPSVGDIYSEIAPIALRLQGQPPEQMLRTAEHSQNHRSGRQFAAPTTGPQLLHENPE